MARHAAPDVDLIDGVQEDATARVERILADEQPPAAKPTRKQRSDAGQPRTSKPVKAAQPYYINLPGVRFDVSTDEGNVAFKDWLDTNNYDLGRDEIASLINTLVIDVLEARAKA